MFEENNIYKKPQAKVAGMSSRQQVIFLMNKTQKEANWDMNNDSDLQNEPSEEDTNQDLKQNQGLTTYNERFEAKMEKLRIYEQKNHPERLRLLAHSLSQFIPIKKNKYLERKKINLVEVSSCTCVRANKKGEGIKQGIECDYGCINRVMMIECQSITCPVGVYCSNRRFQLHQNAYVYPIKTEKKGWGLFAGEFIPKNTFVMQYVGEVFSTDSDLGQERLEKYKHSTCTYLMQTKDNEVIDPTYVGNIARFINHSCDPNCITQKWTVLGECCVGIFTVKDIKENEELSFDYQFDFFKTPFTKCYCGTSKCKGFLGVLATGNEAQKSLSAPECGSCQAPIIKNEDLLLCKGACKLTYHIQCAQKQDIRQKQIFYGTLDKKTWNCKDCQYKPGGKKKRGRKSFKELEELRMKELQLLGQQQSLENPQEDKPEELPPWESKDPAIRRFFEDSKENRTLDLIINREIDQILKDFDKKTFKSKRNSQKFSHYYNFISELVKRLKLRIKSEKRNYKFRKTYHRQYLENLPLRKALSKQTDAYSVKTDVEPKRKRGRPRRVIDIQMKEELKQDSYIKPSSFSQMGDIEEDDDDEEMDEEDEDEEEEEEYLSGQNADIIMAEEDDDDEDEEEESDERNIDPYRKDNTELNLENLINYQVEEFKEYEHSPQRRNLQLAGLSEQNFKKTPLKYNSPRKISFGVVDKGKDKGYIIQLAKSKIEAFFNESLIIQEGRLEQSNVQVKESKLITYEPVFNLAILDNIETLECLPNFQIFWEQAWGGMVQIKISSTFKQFTFLTSMIQEITNLFQISNLLQCVCRNDETQIERKAQFPFETISIQIPKNFIRKVVGYKECSLQFYRNEFNVDFDYNKDLMVDDVFPINENTGLRIFGRGPDVVAVNEIIQKEVGKIQMKTLFFQIVDCKLLMENVKEIKTIIDPCEVRVKRMTRDWKDLRHPFYYLPNYFREVILIGSQEEVDKAEKKIEEFFIKKRDPITANSNQISFLLPISTKPHQKEIRDELCRKHSQVQVFLYEPQFPRKHMTVLLIGPWNHLLRAKVDLAQIVNNLLSSQNQLKETFESFQRFTYNQQIRFSFKSLKRFTLERDIKYLNHWDLVSFFVENAGNENKAMKDNNNEEMKNGEEKLSEDSQNLITFLKDQDVETCINCVYVLSDSEESLQQIMERLTINKEELIWMMSDTLKKNIEDFAFALKEFGNQRQFEQTKIINKTEENNTQLIIQHNNRHTYQSYVNDKRYDDSRGRREDSHNREGRSPVKRKYSDSLSDSSSSSRSRKSYHRYERHRHYHHHRNNYISSDRRKPFYQSRHEHYSGKHNHYRHYKSRSRSKNRDDKHQSRRSRQRSNSSNYSKDRK